VTVISLRLVRPCAADDVRPGRSRTRFSLLPWIRRVGPIDRRRDAVLRGSPPAGDGQRAESERSQAQASATAGARVIIGGSSDSLSRRILFRVARSTPSSGSCDWANLVRDADPSPWRGGLPEAGPPSREERRNQSDRGSGTSATNGAELTAPPMDPASRFRLRPSPEFPPTCPARRRRGCVCRGDRGPPLRRWAFLNE